MGGVEDDGPPSKRVKVSSGESGGLSNGVSLRERGSCSMSDSMARVLASQGDDEVVGSSGVIKKVEFVRIIAEALYSLGYSKSGANLEEESGIPLRSPEVDLFMHQILEGQWDESVSMLHEIGLIDETIIKLASFVILEQKFFELLDGGKFMDALKTLRSEITPLCINDERVRELSSFIVAPHKIYLMELVALVLQKDACRFHNSAVGKMSLLTDHQCGRDHIPSQTLQILQEHSDEVWFLQFSHNGKYLASSSGDCLVIIWEVTVDGRVSLKHRLSGHRKPVSYISWSPEDDQLLTCGVDETIRRWDIASGECHHIYQKTGLGLVSCAWAPNGKSIFSGTTDKSISMWNLEGNELECWRGQRTTRIADLGITMDGKELITVCKETTIMLFGWETKFEKFIEEDQPIISFALSEDKKFLLVSLLNEELHLWNIDGSTRLIAKYKGHKRSCFVVRPCFGGLEQSFIVSGSEDYLHNADIANMEAMTRMDVYIYLPLLYNHAWTYTCSLYQFMLCNKTLRILDKVKWMDGKVVMFGGSVYIWHRLSGELILTLAGHSGAVNCVSWNPTNPHMLASASDDRTIRIWGLNQVNMNINGRHSNGVHHCNGGA
ncbi:hypothetical protein DH2020_012171 [Rehmannia glutinosa]|uniref:CTLH domain-containing protein n=1 Tax=Rehmannia glutinosa TaxID=99300 RepID=A0ABR0XFG0_REHGL